MLAWAQHKKKDIEKEREYGWDQLQALEEILQDVEDRAKDACIVPSGWSVYMVPISIEGSLTNAIEQEYDCLCHHPNLHTIGDGRMLQCCIRKHLFNDMLGELPKLPPVRKWSEY
jgi:hypothetical protein